MTQLHVEGHFPYGRDNRPIYTRLDPAGQRSAGLSPAVASISPKVQFISSQPNLALAQAELTLFLCLSI